MGGAFDVKTIFLSRTAHANPLGCALSRSPLPAFKNLGRGVF